MVVFPASRPLARPRVGLVLEMVATAVSLEIQVTWVVMFWVVVSE